MNLIKNFLLTAILMSSVSVFAKGGDDAGNGGFAYRQSIKILKMASRDLEDKIRDSQMKELIDHPERRMILQNTLEYDNIKKLYLWNLYRDRKKLEMDYEVNPPLVKVAKAYFQAFAGKTDTELEDASLEVQKRLLHEAAHIWGYKEDAAEAFAIAFLINSDENSNRPTNSIEIKNDFCSCLKGKSDIISDCNNFCATKPESDQPILYVNTILGSDILANPNLGNLYNWCSVQLGNDETKPQCVLNATDGTSTINLPVTITPGSNSFTANILSLQKDRTWILKLVESQTGSNAQSKQFQIRRKSPPADSDTLGVLKMTPISQYTCFHFGGKIDSAGNVTRTSFARFFYFFPANETPAPIPPAGGSNESLVVCHDEQLYPEADSIEYPRLELIPNNFVMWDKSDTRFIARAEDGGKLGINKILEDRLLYEYNIRATLGLFTQVNYPHRPTTSTNQVSMPLGYIMVPFTDTATGKSFCPTIIEYNGNTPLLNLLGEYMDDTEGLYVAEREAEIIQDGTVYRTVYGTTFVRESILINYGFYIENGLKIKASAGSMHTKTIHYYWPVSSTADPLNQGNRKLFTVRRIDQLNGNPPTGISQPMTTDKRIGCIPRG